MTDFKAPDPNAEGIRKRSVAALELGLDGRGRRATIQVEDLNLADRALAEQFGYNPVRPQKQSPCVTVYYAEFPRHPLEKWP